MPALLDITPRIDGRLAVWPGDTQPTREVLLDIAKGDTVTLSTLRTTVHLGAHADGPNHYAAGGVSIDQMPLEHYLGVCQVIDAPVVRRSGGGRVVLADLRSQPVEQRVLLKTGSYPDPGAFDDQFAGVAPDLVDALGRRGVITIGIDTPSVDTKESKDLPAHAAFARNRMAILEGLVLAHVEAGTYELIALPLPLVGFDASPVRAVLRAMPTSR